MRRLLFVFTIVLLSVDAAFYSRPVFPSQHTARHAHAASVLRPRGATLRHRIRYTPLKTGRHHKIHRRPNGVKSLPPLANSLRRASLEKRQFLDDQVPTAILEPPTVQQARKVNNYFTDSRWLQDLRRSSSLSQNSITRQFVVAPGSGDGGQQFAGAPAAGIGSLNNLFYSSYSSYQPAESGSFRFDDNFDYDSAPADVSDGKSQLTEKAGKKVLLKVLAGVLFGGIVAAGAAYALVLTPPTLVSYSKRFRSVDEIHPLKEAVRDFLEAATISLTPLLSDWLESDLNRSQWSTQRSEMDADTKDEVWAVRCWSYALARIVRVVRHEARKNPMLNSWLLRMRQYIKPSQLEMLVRWLREHFQHENKCKSHSKIFSTSKLQRYIRAFFKNFDV